MQHPIQPSSREPVLDWLMGRAGLELTLSLLSHL